MKISACVDSIFYGQDIIKGLEVVKKCGIDTIEFWGWSDKDLDVLEAQLVRLDMKVSTFCTKATSLVDIEQHESYLLGLSESLEVAKRFGVKGLIGLVGNDTGEPRIEQRSNLIKGLKKCIPMLKAAGVVLMIEPLNILVDHEGYYLYSSKEAFGIIEEINSPYIKVLFDIYHQQISEGNLINNMSRNSASIGHIHAAGNPGRNELYLGEINYKEVLKKIETSNYEGFIGLEYFPTEAPEIGLKKIIELLSLN